MKKITFILLFFFVGLGFTNVTAQSQNDYDKKEVMDQITDLHPNLQKFIDDHFEQLKNNEVAGFMRQSAEVAVRTKYSSPFEELKKQASEAEIENLYADFTESKVTGLFDKYGIDY